MSILLIEDNTADVGLVRRALEEHEIEGELLVISDGETAIKIIDAFDSQPVSCPDLIILDLNLPRRSGHEVLEHIRSTTKCRDASVVVMSSSGVQEDRFKSAQLGVARYLRKPLKLDEFISLGAVFKEVIESSRPRTV